MKIFFLRLLFVLILVFFEFSFFDVLVPWISAPLVLIGAVVAWALFISFPQVLAMTLPLTILFDIISSGMPGTLSLYAIFLVYGMSFVSRRLLVEHYGMGISFYMLYVAVGVFGLKVFEVLFSQGNPLLWTSNIFKILYSAVLTQNLFFSMLLAMPLFVCLYLIIRRFESYMHYVAQGNILKPKY